MQPIISQELKQTVLENKKIKTVYFDEKGRHYLRVLNLLANKNSKKEELFGDGTYSHSTVIPGKYNIDELKERIYLGVADTKIVNQMSREEILDYKVEQSDNSLVGQIAQLGTEERKAILALLGDEKTPTPQTQPVTPTPPSLPTPKTEAK